MYYELISTVVILVINIGSNLIDIVLIKEYKRGNSVNNVLT